MPTAPSQVKQETRRYDKKNAMFLAAFPFYKKSVVKFVLKFVGKCKKTNKQTNKQTEPPKYPACAVYVPKEGKRLST